MEKTYHGSCHCGAVTFEADLDLSQPTYRCNCSICRRTRFWPAIARAGQFRLLTGQAELTQYLFNTRKNQHYFCKHCGVRCFGIGIGIGTETPTGLMYGVNLGCLDDVSDTELAQAPITYVDGRDEHWDRPPAVFAHL
ncbi:GFA family protein [Vogesella indigofera]|uniref:GFA family protein n=1 Tax=Vogesella indigofera TaxID=45465 RepID=UPI00234F5F7E|nr:GFA family protein [Vogesella indigofera]MDC7698108.1 GFA family protein [Vogesella indigofera]